MSERDSEGTRAHGREHGFLMFVLIPFAVALVAALVAVLLRRCRAHRHQQCQLAREREQELYEIKGDISSADA